MYIAVELINELEEFYFEGWIYETSPSTCHTYIKNTILEGGIKAVMDLSGVFCGFYKDNDSICVFNDRNGFKDLYYWKEENKWRISTNIPCSVKDVNQLGIIEFVRYCYPLYNRTLLENVQVLPPATLVKIEMVSGKVSFSRYHLNIFGEDVSETNDSCKVNKVIDILEKAVKGAMDSIESGSLIGLANSGGMDSRFILKAISSISHNLQVYSYTYGTEGTDAHYIANKTAKMLDIYHVDVSHGDNFMRRHCSRHIGSPPLTPISNTWYYDSLTKIMSKSKVHITGLNGDNLFGSHLREQMVTKNGPLYLMTIHSITQDELLKNLVRNYNKKGVVDGFMESYESLCNEKFYNKCDEWDFENRQRKHIKNLPWVNAYGEIEHRTPFLYYPLIDYVCSLTYNDRFHKRIYKRAMTKYLGDLGKVRFANTPYSLYTQKWQRSLLRYLFFLSAVQNRILGWSPFYRGNFKRQWRWMRKSEFNFIKSTFNEHNLLFDDFFCTKYINENLDYLLRTNWQLVDNLLTLNLWMKSL